MNRPPDEVYACFADLERIERGDVDPGFVVTHRMGLDEAPEGYRTFKEKEDECVKGGPHAVGLPRRCHRAPVACGRWTTCSPG